MQEPIIYLVDDDAAVRDSLSTLIRSIGLAVKTYDHPHTFLSEYKEEHIGCILLDLRLPMISGLAVFDHLKAQGSKLPVILITGHGDISLCRQSFTHGVADFLTKPIDDKALIESLQKAICHSIANYQKNKSSDLVKHKFARLSDREKEVCLMIIEGLPNKSIAAALSLSVRTVENHRAAVFQKLEIDSLVQLVKMAISSELIPE